MPKTGSVGSSGLADERGAALAEYALAASITVLALTGVVEVFRRSLISYYDNFSAIMSAPLP